MVASVRPPIMATSSIAADKLGSPEGGKERSALTRMLEKSRDEQYNVFMKMFLAQVKNQNPDNPMSTHEMTQSVMSFFSAAEQAQTNKLLKQSNDMRLKEQMASAKSYLNKEIIYEGNVIKFEGNSEDIQLVVPENVQEAELVILDANLQRVKTLPLTIEPGTKTVKWTGDSDLIPDKEVPHGIYYTKVMAIDSKQKVVEIPTILKGTVRQVSYQDDDGDFLLLVQDDIGVEISDLISVRKPASRELLELGQNMKEQIKQYEKLGKLLEDQFHTGQPASESTTPDYTS